MNICFECGGKLKLIAKPGRVTYDEDGNGELWEIPQELKITTCLDCGSLQEDNFVAAKILRSIEGQKKSLIGYKLKTLRWIYSSASDLFDRPGNRSSLYSQTILLLDFREVLLSRGESQKEKIRAELHKFMCKKYPKLGKSAYPFDISLIDLARGLENFFEVWANT